MEIKVILDEEPAVKAQEPDTPYGDHFFDEPHSEPVTIKLTPTQKENLIKKAKEEGYRNLGPAIRDLILTGLKYWQLDAIQRTSADMDRYMDDPIVKQFFLNARDT